MNYTQDNQYVQPCICHTDSHFAQSRGHQHARSTEVQHCCEWLQAALHSVLRVHAAVLRTNCSEFALLLDKD